MVTIAPGAADKIKNLVAGSVPDLESVTFERGTNVQNWKPGASEEVLEVTFKSPKFTDPKTADAAAQDILRKLHTEEAIRNEVILLSPAEYLEHCKKETGELQTAAKAAGIPLGDVDFTQSVTLRSDVSNNQKPKYGTQVLSDSDASIIRIAVATNPKNLEEAEEHAKKIAAEIESQLPAIKTAAIEYIKRKSAIKNLTPEQEKHLQEHEFKVSTHQQGNWTGVHIEIRSPEQVKKRDFPANVSGLEPEELKKTNMMMKIEDADRRAKLAGRVALFTGEKLNKPASYFMDVAGTEDIKNALGKMLHYLVKEKPEYAKRAAALMNENFLVSNEEWNLPPAEQSFRKRAVSAKIKPGTDELKISMRMLIGKGDEMLKALGGEVVAEQKVETPTPAIEAPKAEDKPAEKTAEAGKEAAAAELNAAITAALAAAAPEATAAGAGNVTVCDKDQIAVSASGAAATPEGAVGAAGGACLDKETLKPENIQATIAAATPQAPEAVAPAPKDTPVANIGGTIVTKGNLQSFLNKLMPSGNVGAVSTHGPAMAAGLTQAV